jgi:hypothetical protein
MGLNYLQFAVGGWGAYLFDIQVPKWFFKENLVEFNWIN